MIPTLETIAEITVYIAGVLFIIWAIKEQIQGNRKRQLYELKQYLEFLYEVRCPWCLGWGHDGYTKEGEPIDICEKCESHGFLWRAICPPRWLKHGNTWTQSEVQELKHKAKEAE